MGGAINSGQLDQHIQVLEISKVTDTTWEWKPLKTTWANIEATGKKNLFSAVGLGARDFTAILRKQTLTCHHILLWKSQYLFLTEIKPQGRGHLEVSAALVKPVRCKKETFTTTMGAGNRPVKTSGPALVFPGILTEKYVGYEREETHAVATTTYVLVTPKEITLSEGDLVTVEDGPVPGVYDLRKCHLLDEYKNEYEITWSRDV